MVSTQPVLSLGYFKLKKYIIPDGIKRLFYLSWEDAFWDILFRKKARKGSYILLPDFFCKDVEKNIILRGYKISHYHIKRNLNVDLKTFTLKVKSVNPKVVVIFHTVGIKSNLLINPKWITVLPEKTILIEDAVHMTIDPAKIKLFKINHFIIDSLRKVVPVQGSSLYGSIEDLDFSAPPFYRSAYYSVKVSLLWVIMVLNWSLANVLSDRTSKKLGFFAERLMLTGYDLIGDSKIPASGGLIEKFWSSRVDVGKIKKIKTVQFENYRKSLGGVLPINIPIDKKDRGNLRGFPIILPKDKANDVLRFLRSKGLLVRFELDDSGWAKNQKMIFLPLGIHMTQNQQSEVCILVRMAILGNF